MRMISQPQWRGFSDVAGMDLSACGEAVMLAMQSNPGAGGPPRVLRNHARTLVVVEQDATFNLYDKRGIDGQRQGYLLDSRPEK